MKDPVALERKQRDALLAMARRYLYALGEDEGLASRQMQAVKDALREHGYWHPLLDRNRVTKEDE